MGPRRLQPRAQADPGRRPWGKENVEEAVAEVKGRLGEAPPKLVTSDEYAAYETVLALAYGEEVLGTLSGPGRRPILAESRPVAGLTYATVRKEREGGRVVSVDRKVVLESAEAVTRAQSGSACSRVVKTSFVERQHATGRGRNTWKARKAYGVSKDWRVHEAMRYFTMYSYSFCWAVRTLRRRIGGGAWQRRTPVMAAGISGRVWPLKEWLTFPAVQ